DFVKEPSSSLSLMKFVLRKYPKIYQAMQKRHEVYNQEKAYVFEQEKAGKCFVICPETPLGISRTEKNPNELERVYQFGRAEMQKKLDELRAFLYFQKIHQDFLII
ncbi:MAG: hypothetical protein IIT58_06690, partial [Treponema sp.]|nr:hypothetical protein [Treponema sp.]